MKRRAAVRSMVAAMCICLWLGTSSAGESLGTLLSYEQALEQAMNLIGGNGTVIESDIDHKRSGMVIYGFDIATDEYEYEVGIDGYTGNVIQYKQKLSKDRRTVAGQRLDAQTVKSMARERAGGGTVTKYEVDRDDGRLIHEITVVDGVTRHKMEIDDATGEVVEYSRR